jgi:hypothetical protein
MLRESSKAGLFFTFARSYLRAEFDTASDDASNSSSTAQIGDAFVSTNLIRHPIAIGG